MNVARALAAGAALCAAAASCALVGETGDPARPHETAGGDASFGTSEPPFPLVPSLPLKLVPPTHALTTTSSAIDAWPLIVPGVRAHAVTSFDRSGGNDDGFGGTYSTLYVDDRGEHVVFDASGPGVLRTLWFTSAVDGNAPLALGAVRFYFDGSNEPRLDVDSDALFAGTQAPFVAPLVAANGTSSGGFASWVPIPFQRRLRITVARPPGFYQVHYDTLPPDWDIGGAVVGGDAALAARFAAGASTLALEEQAGLDVTRPGAGTIDVLRFVPNAAPTDAALAAARIAIRFDGSATPQIDLPLGFFFGSGRGVAPVRSVAWTMEPLLFESRLPMPYWDGVRITVSGLAGKLFLHRSDTPWQRADVGTLEAHFRDERPTGPGDFVYADLTGSGKLVATVLGVDPLTASNKGWWEGDLQTRIDGARTPALHGTGHEDDHLGGWSNEFLMRPFTLPMQGCPRTDLYDTGAEFQKNGASTMYRLWQGLPFYESIRHGTEHGPNNTRSASYTAATFVYRQPRARLVLSDGFDVASPEPEHRYTAPGVTAAPLASRFEGEAPETLTATLHTYAEPASFSVAVDPANAGVVIRRLFDRREAPARAVLEVGGVGVTAVTTFGPIADGARWVEEDVFVPRQLTEGKSRIDVRWIPGSRSTAARFEAWSALR